MDGIISIFDYHNVDDINDNFIFFNFHLAKIKKIVFLDLEQKEIGIEVFENHIPYYDDVNKVCNCIHVGIDNKKHYQLKIFVFDFVVLENYNGNGVLVICNFVYDKVLYIVVNNVIDHLNENLLKKVQKGTVVLVNGVKVLVIFVFFEDVHDIVFVFNI